MKGWVDASAVIPAAADHDDVVAGRAQSCRVADDEGAGQHAEEARAGRERGVDCGEFETRPRVESNESKVLTGCPVHQVGEISTSC